MRANSCTKKQPMETKDTTPASPPTQLETAGHKQLRGLARNNRTLIQCLEVRAVAARICNPQCEKTRFVGPVLNYGDFRSFWMTLSTRQQSILSMQQRATARDNGILAPRQHPRAFHTSTRSEKISAVLRHSRSSVEVATTKTDRAFEESAKVSSFGPDHVGARAEEASTQAPGRKPGETGVCRVRTSEDMRRNLENAHGRFPHFPPQCRSEKKYTTEKSPEQKNRKEIHDCFNYSAGNPARSLRSLPGAGIVSLGRSANREHEDGAAPSCHGLCGVAAFYLDWYSYEDAHGLEGNPGMPTCIATCTAATTATKWTG